ncbi:MAG: nucleotidyltransferase domain-containing protein [Armatimonadetes bacterium]|nr:nucleotidyltransferase domain-containing protein [Armatimonadota bacterium]
MAALSELRLCERDRLAVEAAARLLKERFAVSDVILYGSKARGGDDEESNLDLLVLTTRELGWREQDSVSDALFHLGLAQGVVFSVLVEPREEWLHGMGRVLPLRAEIDLEGVQL